MWYDLRCTDCKDIKRDYRAVHCERCGGTLECVYPMDALATLREQTYEQSLARYAPVLPVEGSYLPYLGESQTPLLPSKAIAKKLGLTNLLFKDETQNPTGSFKDRAISISVAMALKTGSKGIMTISSGNAAASLSTYAAACQLPCLVLVDSDASPNKLQQILYMGAKCIKIDGIFNRGVEPLAKTILEVKKFLGYWCAFSWARLNPYSVEGTKTIAYECASVKPDVVICPVGGGDNLAGQWKGYRELYEAAVLKEFPKMIGVQPKGSSPLVLAYNRRDKLVSPIAKASTVVSALKTTFSGDHALKAIYESRGCAIEIEDEEILRYKQLLAELEGIWVEASSAITVAALPKLLESGTIGNEERIVCVLTGAGYKEHLDTDVDQFVATADFDPDHIIEKCVKLTKN